MTGINRLIKLVLVIVTIMVIAGFAACSKSASDKTSDTVYKLTHTAADAEYILSWDSIVSKCPDISTYDKQEAFVHRGESGLNEDSPEAWASFRFVQSASTGDSTRSFGVLMWYFETDEELDEYVETRQMGGLPFQEDGDFMTAVLEQKTPIQSVQLAVASNHICILIGDVASSDKSLFFGKEKLMELLPGVKNKISSLEITPLPPGILERKLNEPQGQQTTLSEVKCNGEEYNLAVKSNNGVVLLPASMPMQENNINDLKSSGLIEEIYEIGRNKASEDTQLNVHFAEIYKNTQLSEGEAWPSCSVVYIAYLPSKNIDPFLERLRSYGVYSYHVLSNNTRENDVRLSFTAKFAEH